MTTNPVSGSHAIVQINNSTYQTVTGIKTADLQIQEDIYDITDLNNNSWKLKLPGLADYTLKLAGNFDLTDAQQAVLQAAIITTPGTSISWKVYPNGTGGSHFYGGSGFLKTQGVKFDVKSEETVSFDIEGSGAISYT
jgi:predicted secreted protein